ncbi:MAG: type II toxin-antitoxin system PemK/MazF family toxin [Propionibacteriaceae bacterium]|nr:type II toxin-antitoxin system PemK/MazF family toxin [Propionibacteriaceae bacterium]
MSSCARRHAETNSRNCRSCPYQAVPIAQESGLDRDCTAQVEQVRSVSVGRVVRLVGRLTGEALGRLDEALRVHLAL